jgi:hypothetical protein
MESMRGSSACLSHNYIGVCRAGSRARLTGDTLFIGDVSGPTHEVEVDDTPGRAAL